MTVALELRYHVPGSQVWPGSRGGQRGNVHLHVLDDVTLGRLTRRRGECLCAKRHGSDERPPDSDDLANGFRCERCFAVAARHGLTFTAESRAIAPEATQTSQGERQSVA